MGISSVSVVDSILCTNKMDRQHSTLGHPFKSKSDFDVALLLRLQRAKKTLLRSARLSKRGQQVRRSDICIAGKREDQQATKLDLKGSSPGCLKKRCITDPSKRRPDSSSSAGTKLPSFSSASAPIRNGPQKLPTLPSIFISAKPASISNIMLRQFHGSCYRKHVYEELCSGACLNTHHHFIFLEAPTI